ncbi:MAG: glycosyltransferase family 2 protein [Halioglobus sp.]
MIVKNEAYFLARCLTAVKDYVDEIILVDTGSTDETKAIAAQFTDKIYDFAWIDDFSAARNYALDRATRDWILVLDADELVAEQDLQAIRELIVDTSKDAFFFIQYNYNDDPLTKDWQPVRQASYYSGGYAGYRCNPIARLFRANSGIRYHGRVHEVIDPSLEALSFAILDTPIHHHMDSDPTKPKRDRQINYLRLLERELEIHPDGRLYASAASVHMHHAQDYAKANLYFERAVELGYNVNQNRESQAEANYRLGQFDESSAIYRVLYNAGYITLSLCINLANLAVKGRDFTGAVELLKEALPLTEPGGDTAMRIRHNIKHLESQINS